MQPEPGASVLPPRRESALARYPRRLKLAAAGCFILLIAALGATAHLLGEQAKRAAAEAAHKPKAHRDSAAPPSPAAAAETGDTVTHFPALNDQDDRSIHLLDAPDPALTETTSQGSLPRIGQDGRQPWEAYARPFNDADRRPRIAIVIADLGLARFASDAAIARLPANVTLAFDAQSPNAAAWLARARADGHETLLAVPMEPFDYPHSDPGPNTLLTSLSDADNIQRLQRALMQGSGYVGVTTLSGSGFTANPDKLQPVLQALKDRGLLFFDARITPRSIAPDLAHAIQLPAVEASALLDQDPSPAAIDKALADLERSARINGHAVGIALPLPVVIERLQAWVTQLPAHGIALAPVSALAQ